MLTKVIQTLELAIIFKKNHFPSFMKSELLILPLCLYLFFFTPFFFSKITSFVIINVSLFLFMMIHSSKENFIILRKNLKIFKSPNNLFLVFSFLWAFLVALDTLLFLNSYNIGYIYYSYIFLVCYFFFVLNHKAGENEKAICLYLVFFLYILSVVIHQFELRSRALGPLHNINGSAIFISVILYLLRAKNLFWVITLFLVTLFFKSASGIICCILLWLNTKELNKFLKLIKKINTDYSLIVCSLCVFIFVFFIQELPRDADFIRIINYKDAFLWVDTISSVGGLTAGSSGTHFNLNTINLESSLLSAYFEYGLAGFLIVGLPILMRQYYLGLVILFLGIFSGVTYSPVFIFFMVLSISTLNLNAEIYNDKK